MYRLNSVTPIQPLQSSAVNILEIIILILTDTKIGLCISLAFLNPTCAFPFTKIQSVTEAVIRIYNK